MRDSRTETVSVMYGFQGSMIPSEGSVKAPVTLRLGAYLCQRLPRAATGLGVGPPAWSQSGQS